jgi:GT2 family glycosyltransferase
MQKPIALLLLNWNTPKFTSDCINSLLNYCDSNVFDIIVADNGSTDGSLSILRNQFPDLTFLDNKENLGFAEGNNKALNYCIGKGYQYSLILNNDTVVDDDLVTRLLHHMEGHPEAAAVQPAIYWMHNKTEIWNGRGGYNSIFGKVYSSKEHPSPTEGFSKAKWLTGCCMLVRNEVLKLTGLFNKQYFLYDEDVELSFRIRTAGFELHYLPQAKLYHEAGASGQLATKEKEGTLSPIIHYYVSRNRIWLLRRFGNPIFYPIMFLYYFPYYAGVFIYFLIRGRRKKASLLFNGLKDGFFTPEKVIYPQLKQAATHTI